MRNKKALIGVGITLALIVVGITLAIMVSCLSGCSCSSQDELHKMINNNEQIVIEVAETDFTEQGTESKLIWTPLAELTNYASFRTGFDTLFEIEQTAYTKNGVLYIDSKGNSNGNNTLYNVFTNKDFIENYWEKEEIQDAISSLAVELYADVDENSTDTLYAAINAYFNLINDNEVNYYNGQASLSRAEAMTMLMRATTTVEKLKSNDEFTTSVGKSDFTDYASYVADDSYLTIADNSLNNQTFNGTITRGEFIYMVVNNIFGSDIISNTDISNVSLKDCKATTKTYEYKETSYVKSYDLNYAIQSPDDGAPADLYKAIAVANKLDVISGETRWDEALTKSECVEIIIDAILAYNNLNGYVNDGEINQDTIATYTENAKTAYASVKDTLSCDEATYVNEYIKLMESGKSPEEIEKALADMFKKNDNDVSIEDVTVPEEPTTEAPTEKPTQKEEPTTKPAYVIVPEESTTEAKNEWGYTASEWAAIDGDIKLYIVSGYTYEEAVKAIEERNKQTGTNIGGGEAGGYEELDTGDWWIN